MSNPNSHIENFLEYYCLFEQELGYAVLLKGKWGTGKTWFIQKTLKSFKTKDVKHLYVSLYGITSFDQIEDEFFKQLHPRLSSKSMALTGKIVKGLLKATLKIDLDGDGNISAQAPELNLPEYLTNTSGFVIIFDDLERASIKLESLIGYINHYVEHQGYKVIIVANEEEILEQQENKEITFLYRKIKEKLIGKTFEIEPDLQGALVNFISEIKNQTVKDLYESNINVISELYNSSKYQNLRHLKQALWDFERFVTFVSEDASSKNELLLHLLKIFLILSFEIKSGNILPQDITRIQTEWFSTWVNENSENKEDTPCQTIRKKYGNIINLISLLIEESIWVDFFDKGCCSAEKIQESLEKSEYYHTENTPDWMKLLHSMELSDDEFSDVLKSVHKDFFEKKFTEIGVIKHVVGIFLWLSDRELITENRSEILKFSYSYIDDLKNANQLFKEENFNMPKFRENEAWGNIVFYEKDSEEFKKLIKHIDKRIKESVIEHYPDIGNELLNLIETDPDLFCRKVMLNNHADNIYYAVPIFQYIDSAKFVDSFVSAKSNARRKIGVAFLDRYQKGFNDLLLPELEWLRSVIKLLEEKKHLLEGKISGYQLQSNIDHYFKTSIKPLEQHKVNKN